MDYYVKKIVCLANSRKPPSGRCIAGKVVDEALYGTWLRPVSARPTKEVSEEERRYQTGLKAEMLDIIQVPLLSPAPCGHQSENEVLAHKYYWAKAGRASWDTVTSLIDPYDPNFWTEAEHTRYGINDKVAAATAGIITSSLKLIQPQGLRLHVLEEEGFEGAPNRKRVRAKFTYNNVQYELSVTDPVIEDQYLQRNVGYYPIETSVLCISLAEVWNGYAFRLVASLITPERCTTY